MFSDMELGTKIFLGILGVAVLYFGGKNIFNDGGTNGPGAGRGTRSGGRGGSTPPPSSGE